MYHQGPYLSPAPPATQRALPYICAAGTLLVPWRIWATATATQPCTCGAQPGQACVLRRHPAGCHLNRIAAAWTDRAVAIITKGDMQMVFESVRYVTEFAEVPGGAA